MTKVHWYSMNYTTSYIWSYGLENYIWLQDALTGTKYLNEPIRVSNYPNIGGISLYEVDISTNPLEDYTYKLSFGDDTLTNMFPLLENESTWTILFWVTQNNYRFGSNGDTWGFNLGPTSSVAMYNNVFGSSVSFSPSLWNKVAIVKQPATALTLYIAADGSSSYTSFTAPSASSALSLTGDIGMNFGLSGQILPYSFQCFTTALTTTEIENNLTDFSFSTGTLLTLNSAPITETAVNDLPTGKNNISYSFPLNDTFPLLEQISQTAETTGTGIPQQQAIDPSNFNSLSMSVLDIPDFIVNSSSLNIVRKLNPPTVVPFSYPSVVALTDTTALETDFNTFIANNGEVIEEIVQPGGFSFFIKINGQIGIDYILNCFKNFSIINDPQYLDSWVLITERWNKIGNFVRLSYSQKEAYQVGRILASSVYNSPTGNLSFTKDDPWLLSDRYIAQIRIYNKEFTTNEEIRDLALDLSLADRTEEEEEDFTMVDSITPLASASQGDTSGQTITWFRGTEKLDLTNITSISGVIYPLDGEPRDITGTIILDSTTDTFQWQYSPLDTSTIGYHTVQFTADGGAFTYVSIPQGWNVYPLWGA